jgi:hypothetical protein
MCIRAKLNPIVSKIMIVLLTGNDYSIISASSYRLQSRFLYRSLSTSCCVDQKYPLVKAPESIRLFYMKHS